MTRLPPIALLKLVCVSFQMWSIYAGYILHAFQINRFNPPFMYLIVWKYDVKSQKEEAFEKAYGPSGTWQQFFERSTDHVGSFLYRGDSPSGNYLIIDRWESKDSYEAFLRDHRGAYDQMTENTRPLYNREEKIGAYMSI